MTTFAPTFQMLPPHAIVPSPTNPRKHFDQAALDELASSIAATGVHTPVLVRPLPAYRLEDTAHLHPRPTHELVAGERRWRASVQAKAESIPAMVQELTDGQAREIQIIENLQRQDLTALEEAEGYQSLIDQGGMTAEQVASKIGKSRAYVYGRLKLLDAGQDVRDALRQGMIGREQALLLARIPSTLLQVKALKEIVRTNHPDGVMSARQAGEWIRAKYMLKIEQAPFDHTDASLSPRACTICPTRTGADPDIFMDVMGADMCTDPSCYDNKVQQHHARRRAQLEAAGHQIIEGDDAAELMPYPNSGPEGYARLDDVRDSPTNKPLREELAKLLEKGEVVPVMIVNPHKDGDVLACVPDDQVQHLLERAGRKKAAATAKEQHTADLAKQTEKRTKVLTNEYENAWRARLVGQIKDNLQEFGYGQAPADQVLHLLAQQELDGLYGANERALAELLGLGDIAPEEGLRQWLRTVALGNDPTWTISTALQLLAAHSGSTWSQYNEEQTADNNLMLAIGKGLDIDVGFIKTQVQAEITEREAQKALVPLAPAAQASKKPPAGARAKLVHLNPEDAMQGIACAMQSAEVEGVTSDDGAPDSYLGADAQSVVVSEEAWPFPKRKDGEA